MLVLSVVLKLNTPQFKVVKRSAYAKGTNYLKEIVEYRGQNCHIPTFGMCFIRFFKCSTVKDYTEEFRDFIRKEKYRSGVITSARVRPFLENIIATLVILIVKI